MPHYTLRGGRITLAQVIKAAGLADSGGQAKLLVRLGEVKVNGEVATQPGRKLGLGDRVQLRDEEPWELVAGDAEGEPDDGTPPA